MCQHSGALERKWNRQFTRPIFPAGAKNTVWERDYVCMYVYMYVTHSFVISSNWSRCEKLNNACVAISRQSHSNVLNVNVRDR